MRRKERDRRERERERRRKRKRKKEKGRGRGSAVVVISHVVAVIGTRVIEVEGERRREGEIRRWLRRREM